METNPYESPKQAALPPAKRVGSDAIHIRLIRGITRGALIGATFGMVGGVAILLVLGLWIRTPVLTKDAATAMKSSLMFMAFALMATATVGAVGFGLASLRVQRPEDGSRRG